MDEAEGFVANQRRQSPTFGRNYSGSPLTCRALWYDVWGPFLTIHAGGLSLARRSTRLIPPGVAGMNQLARALPALFLLAATAGAQDSSRLHTHPSVPSDAALQPLNLKLGWRTYIPMDGRRDS